MNLPADRIEWLENRRKGIGGSDIAAIAGLNPWRSPINVYMDKLGELPDKEQSEFAYWGTTLEPIIADEFARRTGYKIARHNKQVQHPKYPWMLGNRDRRIVGHRAGLECKATSSFNRNSWLKGDVPEMYICQCQWYMAVTGWDTWHIACLIGGNQFVMQEIQADPEVQAYLIQIGADFWQLVESKTPPEIDGTEASTELLNIMYPAQDTTDIEIALPELAKAIISDYDQANKMVKDWTEVKDEAANRLKILLGENTRGVVADRRVNWTAVTSNRFDSKRFQKEHPELFKAYLKPSQSRRFTITEIKEA